MPECPICNITLGMWERGLICPGCKDIWSFEEAKSFKGFDINQMVLNIDLFNELLGFNLLRPGKNEIEFFDDGVIIKHLEDIF